jgi:hypothetical protein
MGPASAKLPLLILNLNSNSLSYPLIHQGVGLMRCICLIVAALFAVSPQMLGGTARATSPYTENFTTNAANWANGAGNAIATYVASGGVANGGPDGSSYITSTESGFNMGVSQMSGITVFQGLQVANASSDKFTGNWLASGIDHFSTYVWQNTPDPLTYFVRFATPADFPGTVAIDFAPVLPNTWTKLDFDISPSNINSNTNPGGQLFEEGPGTFTPTFSSVGNIEIGFFNTAGLNAAPNSYSFAIDRPTTVPEPACWILALGITAARFFGRPSRINI